MPSFSVGSDAVEAAGVDAPITAEGVSAIAMNVAIDALNAIARLSLRML